MIKSPTAFDRLTFTGFSTADHTVYYQRRQARNESATKEYEAMLAKNDFKGLYMNTILDERIMAVRNLAWPKCQVWV